MEELIWNPYKGKLETIHIEYTEDNTTWLDDCSTPENIYRITDTENGLLVKENNFSYPVLFYDIARSDIGNEQLKASNVVMEMRQDLP